MNNKRINSNELKKNLLQVIHKMIEITLLSTPEKCKTITFPSEIFTENV